MPTNLSRCAKLLKQDGIRHHLDHEDDALLALFVTRAYKNPRGEHVAIVRIEAPDDGRRCRASIVRAFPTPADPATACLAACRMAAATPLVGAEFHGDAVWLVTETVVEDARFTKLQLLSMIDRLVEAAETWCPAMRTAGRRRRRRAA